MPRIAGDNYAAEAAAEQRRRAAEQARREAAERAQREAAERQRQQAAAAQALRAKETKNPTAAFAERHGLDANFARDRFYSRLGDSNLLARSEAAQRNSLQPESQTQRLISTPNERRADYQSVGDVCPTVSLPAATKPAEKKEDTGFLGTIRGTASDIKNTASDIKNTASDGVGALADAGGDVVHGAVDFGGGVVDFGADAISFGEDAVQTGGRFVQGVANVAVDAGRKTVDFAGDVAGDVKDAAEGALKFAAEQGLKLAGRALDAVHNLALNTIDAGLGVGKNINKLSVGDSYKLGEKVSAGLGVDASLEGQIEVKRDQDSYVVSSELSGDIGLKLGGGGMAGLGGKTEFKFDNAEDAKKATLVLAGAGAAASTVVTAPELALALVPHPGEISFLKDHISAIELKGDVNADVDSKFDLGFAEGGTAASVGLSSSYRVEFEKGRPVALSRATELSGTGTAQTAFNFINKNMSRQGMDSITGAINQGGEAKGTVTVETRIPLDAAKIPDVALFLASPTSAAFSGAAETSVKGSLVVDQGDKGVQGDVEISKLSGHEARQIVGDLVQGKVNDAFRGIKVDFSASASRFEDRGFNPSLDLKVGGFGIELDGYSEQRDVTALRG